MITRNIIYKDIINGLLGGESTAEGGQPVGREVRELYKLI